MIDKYQEELDHKRMARIAKYPEKYIIVDLEGEEWRDVKGWEGQYMVSNKGRVKSLTRKITNSRQTSLFTGRMLHPKPNLFGYPVISQFKKANRKTIFVHRLVAEAFVHNPDPQNKKWVNHIDGIKHNNNVENLEWVTFSENIIHAIETGLQRKVKRQKITEDQAREIKIKLKDGEKMKNLADQYGLAYVTIQGIKSGKRWGWVKI